MKHLVILLALIIPTVPARAAEEVNIYSSRQEELIRPLLDAFTEKTGIKTNVLFASKGLVERMASEGKRGPADVLLTADIGKLAAASEADVIAPVSSDLLEERIPEHLRDPNDKWFALTLRARVIFASHERVAGDQEITYESLDDKEWRSRICTRSGRHNYSIALIAAHIAHHGIEKTRSWLEGVRANLARRPQGNDRAQVKAVWAGECDIAIGNTYYMGKMLERDDQKAWADSVRVIFPRFAEGGTHINISGMALSASAPNRKNAVKLMEYLTSDEAQKTYAQVNYEYPVVEGIDASELVQSWGELESDKMSISEIAKHRLDALKLVDEIGFDN